MNKTYESLFEDAELVQCTALYKAGDEGYFCLTKKDPTDMSGLYWDKCREQFSGKFNENSNGFFYSVKEDYFCNSFALLRDIENFLGIDNISKFYKTTRATAVLVDVSPFWKKCYMRRSLLTLFLRIGLRYDMKNWERYVFDGAKLDFEDISISQSFDMIRSTRNAIMRFMFGYTKYVGEFDIEEARRLHQYFPEKHGWVNEFQNASVDYIKKTLVPETNLDPIFGEKVIFIKSIISKY